MGKRRNVTTPGICNCLQGAGDSESYASLRDQTGEAYWSYVSQVVRGEPWCPVSSYCLIKFLSGPKVDNQVFLFKKPWPAVFFRQ